MLHFVAVFVVRQKGCEMSKRESELKFTCEAFSAAFIKRGIESVCLADDDFSENIISSVYFDTQGWLFAMEKASSDYLKTKVRLRWYEASDSSQSSKGSKCYLEFKCKIGSKRTKSRVLMPFAGDQALLALQDNVNKEMIQQHINEHAPDLYGHNVEPKFVVRYVRSRFKEPFSNTRISFDTDIQAFSVANGFAQQASHVRLFESVLEVKGGVDDLPQALRSFHAGKLKKAAFSKYFESFKLLSGYEQ